ncbi:phospholipase D-like domain-containing protein [Actinocorallia libanotica]|uniref:phospholipase D n=1 Tax=Actinocorallia libanotica TaxID=46162 RepID=A0ABP4BQS0_9ACTN
MRSGLKYLAALLPLAFLLVSAPAHAAYTPPQGALFNRPTAAGAGAENTIQNHLLNLINNAAAGSEIRVVMYTWREDVIKNALISAHADRGVKVKVLMNNSVDGDSVAAYDALRAALGGDLSAGSWAAQCKKGWGCLGTGINHNKFFMFSQAGTAQNVVVQTSANLTYHNRVSYWNNAYTVADAGVYGLYNNYFNRLKTGVNRTTTPDNDEYWTGSSGSHKLYTYPYAQSDTIVNVLDNVKCGTDPDALTRIRVAVLKFGRTAIAEKLVALKKQGCRVYVVFEDFDGSSVGGIISGKLSGIKRCAADDLTVHSKYMTIESGSGSYAGTSGLKLVFTGSHNYHDNSLRYNDETVLRVTGATTYQQYEDNFDEGLYTHCPSWS